VTARLVEPRAARCKEKGVEILRLEHAPALRRLVCTELLRAGQAHRKVRRFDRSAECTARFRMFSEAQGHTGKPVRAPRQNAQPLYGEQVAGHLVCILPNQRDPALVS
jgi:hypothetical protein